MKGWVKHIVRVALIGAISAGCWAQELKIFGDENYPQVIYRDSQGRPSGFLPDILRYYEKASGQRFDIRLSPWKLAYSSAVAGRGGVIGLSKTTERMRLFDYSEPIYYDDIAIVVLRGHEFAFKALDDLRGKKVGVQLGASFGNTVDQAIAVGLIRVEPDQRHVARLKKLLHGRIDAAFIGNGKDGLERLIEADPELRAQREQFVALSVPLTRDMLYLGFPKSMGKRDLLDDFNRVLRDGRAKGELPPLERLVTESGQ